MRRLFFILLLFMVFLSGCKVFAPYVMLRQGKYPISEFPDTVAVQEYKIAPNDMLDMRVFSNNGEKMIDPTGAGSTIMSQQNNSAYLVEFDGQVKFPILGRVPVGGLTLRQAEQLLEQKYSAYFNDPFVQLKVTNNRVIVFPGGQGSQATVVNLQNSNTTLFEALALAGGIVDGKAHKIKLIRGDLKHPQVYNIDLSTIEGMTKANMVLQANDIIYVVPRDKIPQKILDNITPYLTLLTTILAVYGIFFK